METIMRGRMRGRRLMEILIWGKMFHITGDYFPPSLGRRHTRPSTLPQWASCTRQELHSKC